MKTRLPKFFYKIDYSRPQRMGGIKRQASIYALKKGDMIKVGETVWNTASYPGEEASVMRALIELKQIPAKFGTLSESKNVGPGYYQPWDKKFKGLVIRGLE